MQLKETIDRTLNYVQTFDSLSSAALNIVVPVHDMYVAEGSAAPHQFILQ